MAGAPFRHRSAAHQHTPQAPPVAGTLMVLPASSVRPRWLALPPSLGPRASYLRLRSCASRQNVEDLVERRGRLERRWGLRGRNAISRLDVEQRGRPRAHDGGHRSSDSAGTDLARLACRPSRRRLERMGRHENGVRFQVIESSGPEPKPQTPPLRRSSSVAVRSVPLSRRGRDVRPRTTTVTA